MPVINLIQAFQGRFNNLTVVGDAIAGAFRGQFYDFSSRQQINAGGTLVNGIAQVTANQSAITAIVDLTGLTVTVNVRAGRRIKVSAICIAQSDVQYDTISLFIYQDAAQVQQSNLTVPQASLSTTITSWVDLTPATAGSHTYKLRMSRSGGAGSVTMKASSTFPAILLVEDIGV